MGRKSSAKEHRGSAGQGDPPKSTTKPFLLSAIAVALVGVGVAAMWGRNNPADLASTDVSAAPTQTGAKPPDPAAVAKNEAAAEQRAALGPRKQANLPPLPVRGYAPPRPMPVVQSAYQFAAEHPEILSYVPCFCGCQNSGHRGNDDCFVKARAANGDVTEWVEILLPTGRALLRQLSRPNRRLPFITVLWRGWEGLASLERRLPAFTAGEASMLQWWSREIPSILGSDDSSR